MVEEKLDATKLVNKLLERIGVLSQQVAMLEIRLNVMLEGVDNGDDTVPTDELDERSGNSS